MSRLDELRTAYEEADAAAVQLSGEHQAKVDELSEQRRALTAEYHDRIAEANQKAAEAQQAYLDAEAATALLDHPDPEAALANHSGDGGDRLRAAYEALKNGE